MLTIIGLSAVASLVTCWLLEAIFCLFISVGEAIAIVPSLFLPSFMQDCRCAEGAEKSIELGLSVLGHAIGFLVELH